jgi:hypothetical protein
MKTLVATVLMAIPIIALAQGESGYQCTLGELTRRVEIMHETGVTVPCEVHYYKDTEAPGEREVLWRAMNQEGYCEAKTTEFIARLSAMGWDCGVSSMPAGDDGMDEAEPEASDDTESLAPAEEEIELPDPGPGQ